MSIIIKIYFNPAHHHRNKCTQGLEISVLRMYSALNNFNKVDNNKTSKRCPKEITTKNIFNWWVLLRRVY